MNYNDVVNWWHMQSPKPIDTFIIKQASCMCNVSDIVLSDAFVKGYLYSYTGPIDSVITVYQHMSLPRSQTLNPLTIQYVLSIFGISMSADSLSNLIRRLTVVSADPIDRASYILLTRTSEFQEISLDICQILVNYLLMSKNLPPFVVQQNDWYYKRALISEDKDDPIGKLSALLRQLTITTWLSEVIS